MALQLPADRDVLDREGGNMRFSGTIIPTLRMIELHASSYNFSDVGIAMVFEVVGIVLCSHSWLLFIDWLYKRGLAGRR